MLTTTGFTAAQETNLDAGWGYLARYLYRDAGEAFAKVPASDWRLRDLGRAASLLNEPPVTKGSIGSAESMLREVIAQGPRDDTTLYAQYLLARIVHMHQDRPVAEVEAAYRAAIDLEPTSPAAQVAASHLALVLLYQRPDLSVAERLAVAAELELVAGNRQLPEVAVAYYRSLAEASLFYEIESEQVVTWLQQAHQVRSGDQLIQISLSLQIAEVSRALGRRDRALTYYREFLATAVPTDQRYYTAKLRMQGLEEAAR